MVHALWVRTTSIYSVNVYSSPSGERSCTVATCTVKLSLITCWLIGVDDRESDKRSGSKKSSSSTDISDFEGVRDFRVSFFRSFASVVSDS